MLQGLKQGAGLLYKNIGREYLKVRTRRRDLPFSKDIKTGRISQSLLKRPFRYAFFILPTAHFPCKA